MVIERAQQTTGIAAGRTRRTGPVALAGAGFEFAGVELEQPSLRIAEQRILSVAGDAVAAALGVVLWALRR